MLSSALQSYNWKHLETGHLGSPSYVPKLEIDMIPHLEGPEASSNPEFSFYKGGNKVEWQ